MKFVSKLSVISLIVLMFSFINVAQAGYPACTGSGVGSCDASKTQAACESTHRLENLQKGFSNRQCQWDGSICAANGAGCGTFCTVQGHCNRMSKCSSKNICTDGMGR